MGSLAPVLGLSVCVYVAGEGGQAWDALQEGNSNRESHISRPR